MLGRGVRTSALAISGRCRSEPERRTNLCEQTDETQRSPRQRVTTPAARSSGRTQYSPSKNAGGSGGPVNRAAPSNTATRRTTKFLRGPCFIVSGQRCLSTNRTDRPALHTGHSIQSLEPNDCTAGSFVLRPRTATFLCLWQYEGSCPGSQAAPKIRRTNTFI